MGSENIIARLRRAASKVMPEDPVRVRMTAHDADFLADSADHLRAILSHMSREPLREDYTFEEYCLEHEIWLGILTDWSQNDS